MKYYICSNTCLQKKDSTIAGPSAYIVKVGQSAVTWLHTKLSETVVVVNSMHDILGRGTMWVGDINLTELLSKKT